MQEQNWEELRKKIEDSAGQVTVPDALEPDAVKKMLEIHQKQKQGRKPKTYRKLAGLAAAFAVLVAAGGTYALQKNRNDTKTEQISVKEETTENTKSAPEAKKQQIGMFRLAQTYDDVYAAVSKKETLWKEISMDMGMNEGAASDSQKTNGASYSTTNLQVEGVDESDIVKNDGRYLYVLKEDRVTIVDIQNRKMEKVAEIRPQMGENDSLLAMYVDNDRLLLVQMVWDTSMEQDVPTIIDGSSGEAKCSDEAYVQSDDITTKLLTYDISDRTSPSLTAQMEMDGEYRDSRKVGDMIYLFTWKTAVRTGDNWKEGVIPQVAGEKVDAGCFYVQKDSTSELIMASVDTRHPSKAVDTMVLMGNNREVYMGTDAIYLYGTNAKSWSKTDIAKFSYKDGKFSAVGAATVKGDIEDTFAISEKDGILRVLTTDQSSIASENRLYLLDEQLKKIGCLENIAKGEEVYAARYIGDIAYFITYHNTDPLYAVDISDPANPKKLGFVKMTGYSDYLHPFGDHLLLGIGYETVASTSERTGVKLTMFDVSAPTNPKIADTVIIQADTCNATYDYKCAFADIDRGLIGFATSKWEKNKNQAAYVLYHWNGASFENVLTQEKKSEYGIGGIRGLSANDRFYVLREEENHFILTSYDLNADYREIEEQKF